MQKVKPNKFCGKNLVKQILKLEKKLRMQFKKYILEKNKLENVIISIKEFLRRVFSSIIVSQNFVKQLSLNEYETEVKLYV